MRAKSLSLTIIDQWFKTVSDALKQLNKREHIFNMDESGFAGEAARRVLVVKCGIKYANQYVNTIHYVEVIHVDPLF